MVRHGREACFMKDKKGYLPAHVACSRHCSPEKLHMLLKVNPTALTTTTNAGDTALSLAMGTATRTHPNYALIDHLKRRLEELGLDETTVEMLKDEEERRVAKFEATDGRRRRRRAIRVVANHDGPLLTPFRPPKSPQVSLDEESNQAPTTSLTPPEEVRTSTRKRKVTVDEEEMDTAALLLNFSRHTDKKIKYIASV